MFADPTIDIGTGELLGRYIAEERDSTRMFRACYQQPCADRRCPSQPASSEPRDRRE